MSAHLLESREAGARPWAARQARWVALAVLLGLGVVALLPAAPFLYQTPNNDYSIFLYVGREMVQGKMLYQEVYDHKPPLIFLINAAGVLLGGGQWGVWAIQLVSMGAALALAFLFLERYFGSLPAGVALGVMLANLVFVHERGNLTEEYAYPFQFGALFLLSGAHNARHRVGHFLGIGLLLGLASSLKQTMAGIGAAIVVYLVFECLSQPGRRWRDLFWSLAWMAAGAAAVWLVWFAIFAGLGVFPEFWEGAFLMNFGVSSHSTPERLQTLLDAFRWLTGSSGFFLGGMLIWLTAAPFLVLSDSRALPALSGRWAGALLAGLGLFLLYNGFFRSGLVPYAPADLSPYRLGLIAAGAVLVGLGGLFLSGRAGRAIRRWMATVTPSGHSELALPLLIALVDLPVSLGLAILTGANFSHYFMPLLPSLAVLFAYGIYLLLQTAAGAPARRLLAFAWLAALLLPVVVPGLRMTLHELHQRGDRQVEDTAAYIKANTVPGDPVLQWGVSSAVYIVSGRSAPARYFTTNPLFFKGYSGDWHTSRLLADLRADPPVLIVDTLNARLPLVTAPLSSGRNGWQDCERVQDPAYFQSFVEARRQPGGALPPFTPGIGNVYQWICQNYQPVGAVGEHHWQIYRLKGN